MAAAKYICIWSFIRTGEFYQNMCQLLPLASLMLFPTGNKKKKKEFIRFQCESGEINSTDLGKVPSGVQDYL